MSADIISTISYDLLYPILNYFLLKRKIIENPFRRFNSYYENDISNYNTEYSSHDLKNINLHITIH